jgi:hypothetical protein
MTNFSANEENESNGNTFCSFRRDGGLRNGCVALKAPDLEWDTDDCEGNKDFICEQTRCYYYNYGSIPVSTSQG